MTAPIGRYKNIIWFWRLSEPSFTFIRHRALVLEVFLLALHSCYKKKKKISLHTPPLRIQLWSCWKWSTGLLGLISSLPGLIGRPQPADMWLCLGARWLTDPLPACSAAQVAPSHRRTQFTFLHWPTWPNKAKWAGYETQQPHTEK